MSELPLRFRFVKCHGSGNDFVLVDELDGPSVPEASRSRLARLLSARDGELGADGVLYVLRGTGGRPRMRIFNADGSEPEMCGNGIRCVARYLWERKGVGAPTGIDTMRGTITVSRAGAEHGVELVNVLFAEFSLAPDDLPMVWDRSSCLQEQVPIAGLDQPLQLTALSLSNPHAVVFVENLDESWAKHVGRAANRSPRFPRGVNVSFVRHLSERALFVTTWERGVGVTASCGTGMTAATIASHLAGRIVEGERIEVRNSGGLVYCSAEGTPDALQATLCGNATFSFEGVIAVSANDPEVTIEERSDHPEEVEAYDRFVASRAAG